MTIVRAHTRRAHALRSESRQSREGLGILVRVVVGCVGVGAAGDAARADITVFSDVAAFQSATGATPQPELPNLGLVGRHVAQTTVGDLTFAINNGSPEIALILSEFTALHPGNEIALSDWEALDVTAAMPVYALGSFFVEGTDQPGSCNGLCPCADATYSVRLLLGAQVVGAVEVNVPNDVLSFVGVWSDLPFDRVEYRDLSQMCDNEYWGRFFIGTTPRTCPADFDADGTVDFFDYDAFVICFEGGACPPGTSADFDADGTVDFFDYDAFVVAFEAGC
ncbi:MAG: hypothetical protein AABZ53_01775 [Planctomycetota bacterium]